MDFLASLIRLIIFFGILYLIFTNFGTFLMIIGGFILVIAILVYYIKKQLLKKAQHYEFKFDSSSFSNQGFNYNEFKNFDFNSFNNSNFQGNFYTQSSKLDEAKDFFGFSSTPTKEEIKKRYKELAKKYHPDVNGGNDENMKKLNEYRDILIQAYGN
ncbi:DnaJ domain-containing protein [Aliarcobacter lanthieri]|uniref:J domain-containing protein n=1 Tax=Aliarcobacter lanthieri TaxID=1355374 RepID=UPI0004A6BE21|nr:DnaJ domain-containing protein [Aliarcobacter lanthieri]QKF59105.1 DnaJ domain-containing protein [Aliarcobacter lanthieri]